MIRNRAAVQTSCATRLLVGQKVSAVSPTLGASFADLEAGRALTMESARAFDVGGIPRHRIASAKLYCSEMASRVAAPLRSATRRRGHCWPASRPTDVA
ncbi:acyl-CoA dehydrogenase family protein [Rhodococcus qingshengii]|uniref:acyl-CoA dehydrogenase family protein n=1 Tax=Rhodococcus qingshengii TaxID=334542 RepID=UPI0033E2841A